MCVALYTGVSINLFEEEEVTQNIQTVFYLVASSTREKTVSKLYYENYWNWSNILKQLSE